MFYIFISVFIKFPAMSYLNFPMKIPICICIFIRTISFFFLFCSVSLFVFRCSKHIFHRICYFRGHIFKNWFSKILDLTYIIVHSLLDNLWLNHSVKQSFEDPPFCRKMCTQHTNTQIISFKSLSFNAMSSKPCIS